MALRSVRERLLQTVLYEVIGIALFTPVCMVISGVTAEGGGALLVVLASLVMVWAAVYNTVFDWAEFRLTGHVASDRRPLWRGVHAILLEATACGVTLPATMVMTGLPIWQALWLEMWLTVLYACYALVFHWCYDRLRPVTVPAPAPPRRTIPREAVLQ